MSESNPNPFAEPVPTAPVILPVNVGDAVGALLLNVVQSAAVKYPGTDVVAAAIDIAGVLPPELTTGAVPVTEVTPALSPVLVPEDVPLWLPEKLVAFNVPVIVRVPAPAVPVPGPQSSLTS